jgi:hypothetical protein
MDHNLLFTDMDFDKPVEQPFRATLDRCPPFNEMDLAYMPVISNAHYA